MILVISILWFNVFELGHVFLVKAINFGFKMVAVGNTQRLLLTNYWLFQAVLNPFVIYLANLFILLAYQSETLGSIRSNAYKLWCIPYIDSVKAIDTCCQQCCKERTSIFVQGGKTVGVKSLIPVESDWRQTFPDVSIAVSPRRPTGTNFGTFYEL